MNHLRASIILLSHLTLGFTVPMYRPQFLSVGIKPNIRNLPCRSQKSGESGVCMFATTCEKANGTHLSTCIDRFYFGSCCKLQIKPEIHPQNTSKVGSAPSPLVTTDSSVENNDVSDDSARPKPILDKYSPVTFPSTRPNLPTEKTFFSTSSTATQSSSGLSTFQSLSNNSPWDSDRITTENSIKGSLGGSSEDKLTSSIESTTSGMTNQGHSNFKPSFSSTANTHSPLMTEFTTTPGSGTKSTVAEEPSIVSTAELSTSERNTPPTRFPPRNPTTNRPIETTTSLEPNNCTNSPAITATDKSSACTSSFSTWTSDANSSTESNPSLVLHGSVSNDAFAQPPELPSSSVDADDDSSTQTLGLVTWNSYLKYNLSEPSEILFGLHTTTDGAEAPTNNQTANTGSPLEATVPTTTDSTTVPEDYSEEFPVPTDEFNMSDYKQVCGTRFLPESRIVGGGQSTFGKWPWQLSLQTWNSSSSVYEHSCGAVLLNDNWAITVAHCVENVQWKHLLLRIGDHDLSRTNEPYESQERRVQFVLRNPRFDQSTYEGDLALLRFDEPLERFEPNIVPICLPEDDEYFVGYDAFVTGWGRLLHNGRLPSVLREVSVPVISNADCEGMYKKAGYKERIPNTFVCAGRRKGGVDSCEGDSGGPMVIQRANDNRWILAGIITWGIGCGVPNQPGVYTRISEFRKWITESIKLVDDSYSDPKLSLINP